jgi:hypothetical protein
MSAPAGFEIYRRQRARPDAEPLIAIQRKGILALNHAAYEALGSPESVELLYDREGSRIGLRKTAATTAHAYKVRAQRGGRWWFVSGFAFLRHYGISLCTSLRLPARVEPGANVLAVTIPQHGDPQ